MAQEGLKINDTFFAEDVSLFSVVDDINFSETNSNSDFRKMNSWANKLEMISNPDP